MKIRVDVVESCMGINANLILEVRINGSWHLVSRLELKKHPVTHRMFGYQYNASDVEARKSPLPFDCSPITQFTFAQYGGIQIQCLSVAELQSRVQRFWPDFAAELPKGVPELTPDDPRHHEPPIDLWTRYFVRNRDDNIDQDAEEILREWPKVSSLDAADARVIVWFS
jgi:hypothetical protein